MRPSLSLCRRWLITLCLTLPGPGLITSASAANAWQVTNVPALAGYGDGISALAIDPNSPDRVYLGTLGSGAFRSTDGGSSWTNSNSGLTHNSVNTLVIVPNTPSTLYAGTPHGVFKSTNEGSSWVASNDGIPDDVNIYRLSINATSPSTMYAGTSAGVFKTVDGGRSWTLSGLASSEVLSMALDPINPATVYAGTWGDGVFKSSDEGASWTLSSNGLIASATYVYSLAIDPVTPAQLYASTGAGVFKSTNHAFSWSPTAPLITSGTVYALALSPTAPTTLYAGTSHGVFKSTNQGTSWAAAHRGLGANRLSVIAIAPSAPTTLYAGMYSGKLFKSINGALSSESRLLSLTLATPTGSVALSPAFESNTLNYTATLQGSSAKLAPTAWVGDASIAVNDVPATSGSDATVMLDPGANALSIKLTSGDESSTRTYTIDITSQAVLPPAAPTDVQASPTGSGRITVTWTSPADIDGGISGYLVTAQPGGETCTPTPATDTSCTFTSLTDGQTYTFTVEALNSAGSSSNSGTPPEHSNPATPLVNPRQLSATVPGGSLNVTATGGGTSCGFEHIQIVPASSARITPPAHLHFPYGLLDFVLAGCDQSDVTLSITYPSALQLGVKYWKLDGTQWAPYAHAVAQAGTQLATITLRDGGQGDDDGQPNGRIVDPGQVAVSTQPHASTVAVPTLSSWALGILGISLGLFAWRRRAM